MLNIEPLPLHHQPASQRQQHEAREVIIEGIEPRHHGHRGIRQPIAPGRLVSIKVDGHGDVIAGRRL